MSTIIIKRISLFHINLEERKNLKKRTKLKRRHKQHGRSPSLEEHFMSQSLNWDGVTSETASGVKFIISSVFFCCCSHFLLDPLKVHCESIFLPARPTRNFITLTFQPTQNTLLPLPRNNQILYTLLCLISSPDPHCYWHPTKTQAVD